jgi:hypothetical protein
VHGGDVSQAEQSYANHVSALSGWPIGALPVARLNRQSGQRQTRQFNFLTIISKQEEHFLGSHREPHRDPNAGPFNRWKMLGKIPQQESNMPQTRWLPGVKLIRFGGEHLNEQG